MTKRKKQILSLLLVVLLMVTYTACRNDGQEPADGADSSGDVLHTIGVAVYDPTDPELSMFFDYYREYIAASFPVSFLVSDKLSSAEDEIAFIETMKEAGAEGVISFYGLGLEEIVAACEENQMYYVLGSTSISDEDFDAVKKNPWFLGTIGPADDEEFLAGSEMAVDFIEEGAKEFLIMSGGAGAGNFMHYTRTAGMLTALQNELGLTYDADISTLAGSIEITEVETGNGEISITISPGYVQTEEGVENMKHVLAEKDFDALLSAAGLTLVKEDLETEIKTSDKPLLVGMVDCFSEENYLAVETKDADGNALLNFVKGKYASMVAPAFIAMYNALEGDLDVIKPEGEAFRLYQTYWTASDEEEYVELYGYTQSIFENAYSSIDMMKVIKAYDENADFAQFKALTESSDIDSVRARLKE